MASFEKLISATNITSPERMTSSSLYRSAMSEPNKTKTYNPRRAEMDLYHEHDLEKLRPVIEGLFEQLGQAFAGTRLASKMSQLNTFRNQVMKVLDDEASKNEI